jgi:arylsulfatase A-like enzyme
MTARMRLARTGERPRGRSTHRGGLAALAGLAVLAGLAAGCTEERKRPNVVLIVVDTLRADVLIEPGVSETPNIDALARDGYAFTRAFSHAPMTLPSHTALFSSRLPLETGVLNNGQEVPADLPLLAEWLGRYGYATRGVISLGTLSLGSRPDLRRGFDAYDARIWCMAPADQEWARVEGVLDGASGRQPFFLFAHWSDPHSPYNDHASDEGARLLLDGEELESVTTARMTLWNRTVELTPGEHVFTIVGSEDLQVHGAECRRDGKSLDVQFPQRVPGKEITVRVVQDGQRAAAVDCRIWISDVPSRREIRSRYMGEVEYADRYVGELLADLRRRGLYEDALIVFTSDHGEAIGDHGRVGHVEGLTDDQIHVPLVIKPPRGTELAGVERVDDRLVSLVDVAPTILELIGIPGLPGQRGRPLMGASGDVVHVAETHKPEAQKDQVALRDARYKMIYVVDDERFEMYDLAADPGELSDVFESARAERAGWPDELRALARAAEARGGARELDPELARQLEALGYAGAEPAPRPAGE